MSTADTVVVSTKPSAERQNELPDPYEAMHAWRGNNGFKRDANEAQRTRESAGKFARDLGISLLTALKILAKPEAQREAEIAKLRAGTSRGVRENAASTFAHETGIPVAAAEQILAIENQLAASIAGLETRVAELLRTIETQGRRIGLLEDEVRQLGGEIHVLKNPRK